MEKTFRLKLQDFFDSRSPALKMWNFFIYFLVFATIAELLMEYDVLDLGLSLQLSIVIDLIIASIFSLDYLLRIYASPHRGKFFFNTFNMIDLVAIIPSFVGINQVKTLKTIKLVKALRVARFLRILRIFKFAQRKK